MLTGMSEQDWDVVLLVFRAALSPRGAKGRDDRKVFRTMRKKFKTLCAIEAGSHFEALQQIGCALAAPGADPEGLSDLTCK